MELFK
jgi:hypothetical protein